MRLTRRNGVILTRSRSKRSPRKGKPTPVIAKKQIYVFTEGRVTEPDYVRYWQRKYRRQVLIVIDDFHGGPLQLVDSAIKQRDHDLREERRGRGRACDEYWCVFDRDEHEDFGSAVGKAVSSDIGIAYSNPCIELWFMLHFVNQTTYIHRHDAQRTSKQLLNCEKALTPDALNRLETEFDSARKRAKALDKKHHLDDSAPRSNPSSSAWRLIEAIARGQTDSGQRTD